MMEDSVTMYSLSTCSHCKSVKKLLDECTVQYEFTDIIKKFNPNCSFPTIIIGEKVIVGYKEQEIKEALGL
jgi:glutaredoxin